MSGKLYLCGTPIGNLSDISKRALDTLSSVDLIAAEDTRVTKKLLNKYNITNNIESFHQHNEHEKGPLLIELLKNGKNIALVTDAGMPAISDPGEHLVKLCYENGIIVESVPGPTAVATAVAISGLNTGRFCFEGFLSTNKTNRFEHLKEIKNHYETLVFYEAPHKLLATLKDMREVFGERKISVIKELTKIHETGFLTTFDKAIEYFSENNAKGEFVIVIEGKKKEEKKEMTIAQAINLAKKLKESGIKTSEAANEAAEISGFKKSEIYKNLH